MKKLIIVLLLLGITVSANAQNFEQISNDFGENTPGGSWWIHVGIGALTSGGTKWYIQEKYPDMPKWKENAWAIAASALVGFGIEASDGKYFEVTDALHYVGGGVVVPLVEWPFYTGGTIEEDITYEDIISGKSSMLMSFSSSAQEGTNHTLYGPVFMMHYKQDSRNNEGFTELLGYSYKLRKGDYVFDTGANIFNDSYSQVSFSLFSNIYSEKFRTDRIIPMLMVGVTNKGSDYDSDDRQTYPFVMPKVQAKLTRNVSIEATASWEWASVGLVFHW